MGADDLFHERRKPPTVPMNNDQVWMFDAVRALNGRDGAALVAWWLVAVLFLVFGIAGASVAVVGLGVLFVATAVWWTVNRLRSARENAAIQRYADSRPIDPE